MDSTEQNCFPGGQGHSFSCRGETKSTFSLSDPNWFLQRIRFDQGVFEFAKLDRNVLVNAPFVDERLLSTCRQKTKVPFSEIRSKISGPERLLPRANRFIFHISFSCSTLLSRALDFPGKILSIREPNAFINLAETKRSPVSQKNDGEDFRAVLDAALGFFGRPFIGQETAVIKPSNIANNLIADILGQDPKARAVLLYVPLRAFLISILKKGEAGRTFGRQVFQKLGRDDIFMVKEFIQASGSLTDLQIVTVFWMMQMRVFHAVAQNFPGQILLVNGEQFLDEKEKHLSKITGFFDVPIESEYLSKIIQSPVFKKDAKTGKQSFSTLTRVAENQAVYDANRDAIEAMQKWCKPFIRHLGLDQYVDA